MAVRDLEPEDFPVSIYAHLLPGSVGASWVWAVTVLRPPPGTRTPLYVPSFADYGPVFVTTQFADQPPTMTGPYDAPPFGRG